MEGDPITVGTGLFLSAVLLATVWLFLATQDRWNWARIARRTGAGFLILGLLGGSAIWITLTDYIPVIKPLEKVNELNDIRIGMHKTDVEFLMGASTENTGLGEEYPVIDGHIFVAYDDDLLVRRIAAYTDNYLLGIRRGTHLRVVIRKLGEPEVVSQSPLDPQVRIYAYPSRGVAFRIDKRKVRLLLVADDAYMHPGGFSMLEAR